MKSTDIDLNKERDRSPVSKKPDTKKKVYLVSGWKSSGKDTLCQQFQEVSDIPWNWKVLRKPGVPNLIPGYVSRLAFGDLLKQEVKQRFGFDEEFNLDTYKDHSMLELIKIIWINGLIDIGLTLTAPVIQLGDAKLDKQRHIAKIFNGMPLFSQFMVPSFRELVQEYFPDAKPLKLEDLNKLTVTDILMEHAQMRRLQDPDYFAKHVYQEILKRTKENFMITDLRFSNELSTAYGYLYQWKIITVRVFRKTVPVPSKEEVTEHDLDTVEPDYLLIPLENWQEELDAASKRFSYCHKYKLEQEEGSSGNQPFTDFLDSFEDGKSLFDAFQEDTGDDEVEDDEVEDETDGNTLEHVIADSPEDKAINADA